MNLIDPDLQWPVSAMIADNLMMSDPEFEFAKTYDTLNDADFMQELLETVTRFVQTHRKNGFVLVKTSTTGNRPANHEVSTSLLSSILAVATSEVGAQNVFLGDGPAYAFSYLQECQRLGWDRISQGIGVHVVDLNQDSAEEKIPGWGCSSIFLSADCVINLCKAKTHRRFGVSLGAKSLLGVLSPTAGKLPKLEGRHSLVPWLLLKLIHLSPPALTIIDGNEGIEGQGPLNGTPTSSHFVCAGTGYYSPDLRAAIEMGFDPALIPAFIRPGCSRFEERAIHWASIRVTNTDFIPAVSCSWLYRSLVKTKRREKKYESLLRGAKLCWPTSI